MQKAQKSMGDKSQEYSIGELSREFGITTRSIRHYEDIGLLAPQRRGQTRIYSPTDYTKLKLILRGKRLGFSLEQSKEIIALYNPKEGNTAQLNRLIERIYQQRKKLQQQLDDIQHMMRDLDDAEASCLTALNTAKSHSSTTGNP